MNDPNERTAILSGGRQAGKSMSHLLWLTRGHSISRRLLTFLLRLGYSETFGVIWSQIGGQWVPRIIRARDMYKEPEVVEISSGPWIEEFAPIETRFFFEELVHFDEFRFIKTKYEDFYFLPELQRDPLPTPVPGPTIRRWPDPAKPNHSFRNRRKM